jgi:flavin-binding protein dodecin
MSSKINFITLAAARSVAPESFDAAIREGLAQAATSLGTKAALEALGQQHASNKVSEKAA